MLRGFWCLGFKVINPTPHGHGMNRTRTQRALPKELSYEKKRCIAVSCTLCSFYSKGLLGSFPLSMRVATADDRNPA